MGWVATPVFVGSNPTPCSIKLKESNMKLLIEFALIIGVAALLLLIGVMILLIVEFLKHSIKALLKK